MSPQLFKSIAEFVAADIPSPVPFSTRHPPTKSTGDFTAADMSSLATFTIPSTTQSPKATDVDVTSHTPSFTWQPSKAINVDADMASHVLLSTSQPSKATIADVTSHTPFSIFQRSKATDVGVTSHIALPHTQPPSNANRLSKIVHVDKIEIAKVIEPYSPKYRSIRELISECNSSPHIANSPLLQKPIHTSIQKPELYPNAFNQQFGYQHQLIDQGSMSELSHHVAQTYVNQEQLPPYPDQAPTHPLFSQHKVPTHTLLSQHEAPIHSLPSQLERSSMQQWMYRNEAPIQKHADQASFHPLSAYRQEPVMSTFNQQPPYDCYGSTAARESYYSSAHELREIEAARLCLAQQKAPRAPVIPNADYKHELGIFEGDMAIALCSDFQGLSIPRYGGVVAEQERTEDHGAEFYRRNRNNTIQLPLPAPPPNPMYHLVPAQIPPPFVRGSISHGQSASRVKLQTSQLYSTEQEKVLQVAGPYSPMDGLPQRYALIPLDSRYSGLTEDQFLQGFSPQAQALHRRYNSLTEPSLQQRLLFQRPLYVTQPHNPAPSNLPPAQHQQACAFPETQIPMPLNPPDPIFGHRRKPTNENGVPHPEIICSIDLLHIPMNALAAHVFSLIGKSGKVRSLEFTTGSTANTKSALVIFAEARGARDLLYRSQTLGLRLDTSEIHALPGFIHIYSHPAISPDQTRILRVGGWGEDMQHYVKLIDFCHRRITGFSVVLVTPYTEEGDGIEGTFYVWELHFTKIEEAVNYKQFLEREKFYGQILKVEFGMDPCEALA